MQTCTNAMKKRKSVLSRAVSSAVSAAVAVLSVPTAAPVHTRVHAEQTQNDDISEIRIIEGETSEYGETEIRLVDENGDEITPNLIPERGDMAGSYPSSYDLRDYGYLTPVKNQYPTDTCWAHSVMAVAESYMIRNGLADNTIDLSEAHLVWFSRGRYSTDTSDPLYMDGDNYGTEAYDVGGYPLIAQSALSRWSGVQLEENAPSVTTKPELSESQRYTSYGYLLNSCNFDPSDTDSIKSHLMNDGALTISYNTTDYAYGDTSDCYSDTYNSYYQTAVTDETNHAITLVGWDDDFSRYNFEGAVPEGDGAWLCRNSWGEYFLDGGYFYISYYEPTIRRIGSYEIAPTDTYDSLYQYDGSYQGGLSSSAGISGANVYTANQNETINAVGFYTSEASVPYIVSIYKNVEDGNPMSGTLLTTQKGTITYAGYHCVDLLEGVNVNKDESFSVVLTLNKANTPLYYDNCVDKTGISYCVGGTGKSTSSWTDYSASDINFCIKVYTHNGVEINEENFPDSNFRTYVQNTWDSDGNGYLSDTEAASAEAVNVNGLEIYNLTGIEYFTSLKTLNCGNNPLLGIDLGANTAMTALTTTGCSYSVGTVACSGFSLSGLDTSKITAISGASVNNGIIYPTDMTVNYSYDCGNGFTASLLLELSGITHSLGSWTYSTSSIHTRRCDYCTYSESGPHSFGAWIENGENHIHTCTICSGSETANHSFGSWTKNSDGTHSRTCSDCGYIETSDHTFTAWTDDEDGTHIRTCTGCGEIETAEHIWGDWTDNGTNHIRECTACGATETASHGYSEWTKLDDESHEKNCSFCGDTVTTLHDFSDWTKNSDGTHSRTCSDCGYIETSDHAFTAWTDNGDGTHIRTCTACGTIETAEHVWGDWTDNGTNHIRECTVCGVTETASHGYSDWAKLDDESHAKICSSCGDTVTALHDFSDWTKNSDGTHSRTCSDCGYIETADHAFTAWTDNGDGTHIRTCTACGTIETAEHIWGDWTDNGTNHIRECTVCGVTETASHGYSEWIKLDDESHEKTCSFCGDTVTTLHDFSDWTKNSDGTHSRTCSDCGYIETADHAFTAWTDNEDGTHVRTCTGCGEIETAEHVWGDWTDNGTNHIRECTVCGAEESCGHNFSEWTDNGKAQLTRSCSECGASETKNVEYTPGDLNRDGIINIFDVVIARQGFLNGFTDSASEAACDVDSDGKLYIADMVRLQSYVAGVIDSF